MHNNHNNRSCHPWNDHVLNGFIRTEEGDIMIIKRYEGKVALVTGASDGIGECMVRRLVEEGAVVAALARSLDRMKEKYQGIDEIYPIYCDVASKESVDRAVAEAIAKFGQIDVAFSNAGMIGRTSLLDTTEEDWKWVMDVNLNGTFYVNQAVLRQMVENGIKGAVVNTSSIASQVVSPNTGAYAASKGAVSQLTKFAAIEMAPYGIRVNAIAPGASVTKITEGTRFNAERNDKFLSNIPMGRYGEPEEAAALALYLGSDDSSYVTGVTIMEDGGFSLF